MQHNKQITQQAPSKIPLLSFFTGGGFLDMGFETTKKFEVAWTNEFDATFAELYQAGYSSWRKAQFNDCEVHKISNQNSIEKLTGEIVLQEAFGDKKPPIFGVIGGPPCQDFSMMGKMKGFEGSKGKMTREYLRMIAELKPTFFIMENVAGLKRVKRHWEHLIDLLELLKNDYFIEDYLLNALNYGVPQSRERLFIVGISKHFCNNQPPNFKKPLPLYPLAFKLTWGQHNPFGEIPSLHGDTPLSLCVESCLIPNTELNFIPNANEFFPFRTISEKILNIGEGETNRRSFRRLHRYKYSPTACYGNNEVHLHPYQHRRLSVRETLRIQGVSDTYVLPENISMTKKFRLIGNGVPVALGTAIATIFDNIVN